MARTQWKSISLRDFKIQFSRAINGKFQPLKQNESGAPVMPFCALDSGCALWRVSDA
jgi:hypothetical protein